MKHRETEAPKTPCHLEPLMTDEDLVVSDVHSLNEPTDYADHFWLDLSGGQPSATDD